MTAISRVATAGCVSPVVMHDAAIAYDRTVSRTATELLLLNIARSRWYHPIHFTAISSIAATFEFSVQGGFATGEGCEQRFHTDDHHRQVGTRSPMISLGLAGSGEALAIPIVGAKNLEARQ
jgi:hypothetical protein